MRRRLVPLVLLTLACVPAARVPMPVTPLRSTGADTLVVLLPGRYDDADDFRKRRFVEIAREAGATFDVSAADAHVGYYAGGAVAERIEDDVVLPARRAGYQKVWLAGISLGGLGSLIYLEHYPRGVEGIFLMAPYLGEREAALAVERAGGLPSWDPPDVPRDELDFSTRIWAAARTALDGGTPLILAYGSDDDLAPQIEVLARALPPERVRVFDGGHEWAPWLEAWRWFAASGIASTTAASK
jgi:pimeloyl-ACP methyl ester carboxylesterase